MCNPDERQSLSTDERNKRLIESFDDEIIVVAGIARYKSNGDIPSPNLLDLWHAAGKEFNLETSRRLRAEQEEADVAELLSRRPVVSTRDDGTSA